MGYTEDQILDNVIRVYNRLPIIHFDIAAASSTVKQTGSGTFGGGQSLKRGLAGAFEATRPATFGLEGKEEDTLDIDVKPVLSKNEVYTAYEAFAFEPGRVVVCDYPPDPSVEHVGKYWVRNGYRQYYYIPYQYRDEYFQLALRTTVKRGIVEGGKGSRSRLGRALDSPDVTPPSSTQGSEALEALEDSARFLRQLENE